MDFLDKVIGFYHFVCDRAPRNVPLVASEDLVAIDVEAMKVLLAYKARNKLLADPWQSPQIVTALRHNLGSGRGNYLVLGES